MPTKAISRAQSTFALSTQMMTHALVSRCTQCPVTIPTACLPYKRCFSYSSEIADPLLWPQWKKNVTLAVCALYAMIGNGTTLGEQTDYLEA